MRKKMSLRLDAKAHLQNYHYPLVRGIGTRQLGAGAGSRAGELTRRIPAGSAGCLSEGERALERTGRGPTSRGANEAKSSLHTTHTQRQERLPKAMDYGPFVTLALCSGNKDNIQHQFATSALREHVWTPDYERANGDSDPSLELQSEAEDERNG
jgi:hypothetical protein